MQGRRWGICTLVEGNLVGCVARQKETIAANRARGTRLSVTGSYKCFVIDSDSRWKMGAVWWLYGYISKRKGAWPHDKCYRVCLCVCVCVGGGRESDVSGVLPACLRFIIMFSA